MVFLRTRLGQNHLQTRRPERPFPAQNFSKLSAQIATFLPDEKVSELVEQLFAPIHIEEHTSWQRKSRNPHFFGNFLLRSTRTGVKDVVLHGQIESPEEGVKPGTVTLS